jgi:hypothetical protein
MNKKDIQILIATLADMAKEAQAKADKADGKNALYLQGVADGLWKAAREVRAASRVGV